MNSVPVVHVSFPTPDPEDPFPAMIPMLGFMGSFTNPSASISEPLDLYLHGYISSRLFRLGSSATNGQEEGLPLTIAATHLDGLVLALTPNHHSYNYRSAILHGFASSVVDKEEKLWAMEKITNSVVDDRWENSRIPPTKTEMTSTQILRVKVVDASAKVRNGGPGDDKEDLKDEELRKRVWIGVVPTWTAYGTPIPAPENRYDGGKKGWLGLGAGEGVPEHISAFVKRENEVGEKNAVAAVQGESPSKT